MVWRFQFPSSFFLIDYVPWCGLPNSELGGSVVNYKVNKAVEESEGQE